MVSSIINNYFSGYVDIVEEDGYCYLYRFGKKLRDYYQKELPWYGLMSRCPAGIKLSVMECKHISFDFRCKEHAVNCKELCFESVSNTGIVKKYIYDFREQRIDLYFEHEDIQLYFPYSAEIGIKNIIIDGKAPKKKEKVIFCFGDSITQGFFSTGSSQTYPSAIGRYFNADIYNFGIGGYVMKTQILDELDILPKPCMITFAYGTNDWAYERDYKEDLTKLFYKLHSYYQSTPVYVLQPIVRGNEKDNLKFGTLQDVRDDISKEASKYDNFNVLNSGKDMKMEIHFVEDKTHPNDVGMRYLGQQICSEVEKV